MPDAFRGLQLRSTVDRAGLLTLDLAEVSLADPGPNEVIVQVEATPINPSDLAVMLGSAMTPIMLDTLESIGSADRPTTRARMPADAMEPLKARIDVPLTPGGEGAGTVVAAGANAAHLLGSRVGMRGGAMYAQYRRLPISDCALLPEEMPAAAGASMFINPLTALGFVDTMRAEGHRGIIHLAAASNLGQMLNRICLQDDIPLVNVVRTEQRRMLLREAGAPIVLDCTAPDFDAALTDAICETQAMLAFDPIGGGHQASRILAAMEAAASRGVTTYNRYGTDIFKQLYIYGMLHPAPTVLDRPVGFAWAIGGWLLTHHLKRIGPEGETRLLQRVQDELTTTFASHYTATLSLRDAIEPEAIRAYSRKATGEKYLITPSE